MRTYQYRPAADLSPGRCAVELSRDLIELWFEEVLVGGLDREGALAMRYTTEEGFVV